MERDSDVNSSKGSTKEYAEDEAPLILTTSSSYSFFRNERTGVIDATLHQHAASSNPPTRTVKSKLRNSFLHPKDFCQQKQLTPANLLRDNPR
jgi:hypothetical protein